MPSQITEGYNAGADDYIIKPFDIGLLQARRREGSKCFRFSVEVCAAHTDFFADHINIEFRVGEICFHNICILFQELFVKRR